MLLDDRDARPGVKFADAELLGIPHRIVVGERGLDAGKLEYRHRRASDSEEFPLDDALDFIRSRLAPERRRLTGGRPAGAAAAGTGAGRRRRAAADAQRDPELRAVVQPGDPAGRVLRRTSTIRPCGTR